ncbi:MAG: hypothetical protein CVT90_00275 [Candidatus Altiarchaeales archaeon HGW-Altiarchaeales-3]|nr:MAG: hypothetical protein CVT90_00275 [Candidatus Altiarchaeales archaeon HGW-Altiarchaeales-3]
MTGMDFGFRCENITGFGNGDPLLTALTVVITTLFLSLMFAVFFRAVFDIITRQDLNIIRKGGRLIAFFVMFLLLKILLDNSYVSVGIPIYFFVVVYLYAAIDKRKILDKLCLYLTIGALIFLLILFSIQCM